MVSDHRLGCSATTYIPVRCHITKWTMRARRIYILEVVSRRNRVRSRTHCNVIHSEDMQPKEVLPYYQLDHKVQKDVHSEDG
jgi:hypothetical protein